MGAYIQTGLGDGFRQEGPTGLTTRPRSVRDTSWPQHSYSEVKYLASDFAGLDVTENHMQASPGDSTDTTIAAGVAGFSIEVISADAMTTGGAGDSTGCLAEEDSASDFWKYTATQYSQCRFTSRYLLTEGKGLVHYRCEGNTGSATTDANILNVIYSYVKTSL